MSMATNRNQCLILSFEAEADITKNLGVKAGSANDLATPVDAIADMPIGIALQKADAGERVDVVIHGPAVGTASAAVARDSNVAFDAAGKLRVAVSGDKIVGVAIDAATAADEAFRVFVGRTITTV